MFVKVLLEWVLVETFYISNQVLVYIYKPVCFQWLSFFRFWKYNASLKIIGNSDYFLFRCLWFKITWNSRKLRFFRFWVTHLFCELKLLLTVVEICEKLLIWIYLFIIWLLNVFYFRWLYTQCINFNILVCGKLFYQEKFLFHFWSIFPCSSDFLMRFFILVYLRSFYTILIHHYICFTT